MKIIVLIHLKRLIVLQFLFAALAHADIPVDLLKSAETGNVNAQYEVARSYELGKRVKSDSAQAIKWYIKAVEQGHTNSAYRLGLLYYKGLGASELDFKNAFQYLSLAANKNHKNSQANLAKMYENGDGVEKNEDLSDYWYDQAFTSSTQSFDDYLKESKNSQPIVDVAIKHVRKPITKSVVKSAKKRSYRKIKFPDTLLENAWLQKGKASVYLNSTVNKCKYKKKKITCTTKKLKGRHATGRYKYKLKSMITTGSNDNELHIEYRKLYTSVPEETIEAYAEEAESTEGSLVVGWENKSHIINCKIESANSLLCRATGEDAFYIKRK